MAIDDNFIKRHISIYKATRSGITLHDINEHLSHYIYNYPRKVFGANHESALDFYLYYLERIEKIILSYKESEIKFITWFTYTIRNSYINYMDKLKRKSKYDKIEVSFDAPMNNNEVLTLYDIVSVDEDCKKDVKELAKKIFDYLDNYFDKRDSLIFILHHLELFIILIIVPMMRYFNISYEETYKIIESARATYINKYNDIIKYQDNISKINLKISEAKKKGLVTVHLASKKQQNIKRLNSIRIVVPYPFIASLFDITINAVTKVIRKLKDTLRSKFRF